MARIGNVTPSDGAGFDPIPVGKYMVEIVDSEMKEARSGKGELVKFTLRVMEGEHAGRQIFDNVNFRHDNPQAQEIGQRKLSNYAHAAGHDGVDLDTTDLHRIPMLAVITIKTDPSGQYEPQNEVKRVERLAGGRRSAGAAAGSGPVAGSCIGQSRSGPEQAKDAASTPPWRNSRPGA